VIIPHVVNDAQKWGAGFTAAIDRHFPEVRSKYLSKALSLGHVQWVRVNPKLYIANMVAMQGTRTASKPRPLRYAALVECMSKVARSFEMIGGITAPLGKAGVSIHAPKFGSGLAGGRWSIIEELIQELWDPLVDVTIYKEFK